MADPVNFFRDSAVFADPFSVLTAGMGHAFVFHLPGHLYTVHLLLAGAGYRQADHFGAEDVDSFVRVVSSFLDER